VFGSAVAVRRLRRPHEAGEQVGGSSVRWCPAKEVAVDRQRGLAAAAVAETAGDRGQISAGRQQRGGDEMAEVVKSDRRQADLGSEPETAGARPGGRKPSTSAANTKLSSGSVTPHAAALATCCARRPAISSAAGADNAIVRTERRFFGFGFSMMAVGRSPRFTVAGQ